MKVGGVQRSEPVKPKTEDKEKKFSAVLDQKRKQASPEDGPAPKEASAKETLPKDALPKDLAAVPSSGMGTLRQPVQQPEIFNRSAGKTEETHAAAPSRMVEQLADEITVATKESGVKEVQIQLNSKTFEGLQINISRQDGGIQVQFQTQSNRVAELLQGQSGQLADRLAAKGLTVASISVNRRPGTSRVGATRAQLSGTDETSAGDPREDEARKDPPRRQ